MFLLRLIWAVVHAPFGLLISVDPAQKDQRTSCPGSTTISIAWVPFYVEKRA